MNKQMILQPERYEAPGIKVRTLRSRRFIMALAVSGHTENMSSDEEQTEDFGLRDMGDF